MATVTVEAPLEGSQKIVDGAQALLAASEVGLKPPSASLDDKITVEVALKILSEQETRLRNEKVLPLSQTLREELLHNIELNEEEKKKLATLSREKCFPSLKHEEEHVVFL